MPSDRELTAARTSPLTRPRTPDSRTRSVWLTQLVLAASVVVIVLLVASVQPILFADAMFASGVFVIIGFTAISLVVPWQRLPRWAVLAVPLGDILGVALMSFGTDARFSFLWLFPVTWLATYFSLAALIAGLGLIATALLVDSTFHRDPLLSLTLIVVLLSLVFIGITTHLAAKRTRAFKRLLRRQARRMQDTLDRVSTQERRVSAMMNGIDVGVARLSLDGEILSVNDAYLALYSLDPEDRTAPSQAVEYATFQGVPLAEADRPLARARRGEEFEDESVWLFPPSGRWRALSVASKRLIAPDAAESSMLLVVQDVTALVEAQRAREQLAAVTSHEMRNPLTAIIGHAELALDFEELTPRARDHLETVHRAGERMLGMIAGVLETSRSAFATTDKRAELDLRSIVQRSIDSFAPTAGVRGIDIRVDLPVHLPVAVDAFRMRQVFDNVVSNAVKYTPREGTVTVRGRDDGEHVELSVGDTGIGISPEDLPHIFDPYFRTDVAQETAQGTGLGLGITREIVESFDGSLGIASVAGRGTTVTITLPRADSVGREGED